MPSRWASPAITQRAVADEAGAEQRGGLGIAVLRGQREDVAMVGDGVFRVAAVDLVAGEAGAHAQVFAAALAIGTHAARPADPRHADALAGRETIDAGADRGDDADDLMAEHEGQLGMGQFAVEDVQVGATDAARTNLQEHLPVARLRHGQLGRHERGVCCLQDHRAHVSDSWKPGPARRKRCP